eukprot:6852561-Pyramimonas_sp.AAC.2
MRSASGPLGIPPSLGGRVHDGSSVVALTILVLQQGVRHSSSVVALILVLQQGVRPGSSVVALINILRGGRSEVLCLR